MKRIHALRTITVTDGLGSRSYKATTPSGHPVGRHSQLKPPPPNWGVGQGSRGAIPTGTATPPHTNTHGERHLEDHARFQAGLTRRFARRLVRDATVMSIRAVARHHGVGRHRIMGLGESPLS